MILSYNRCDSLIMLMTTEEEKGKRRCAQENKEKRCYNALWKDKTRIDKIRKFSIKMNKIGIAWLCYKVQTKALEKYGQNLLYRYLEEIHILLLLYNVFRILSFPGIFFHKMTNHQELPQRQAINTNPHEIFFAPSISHTNIFPKHGL